MTIVRVGSNQRFSENWDKVFAKASKKQAAATPDKPSAKKKSAKKKAAPKKAAKKSKS